MIFSIILRTVRTIVFLTATLLGTACWLLFTTTGLKFIILALTAFVPGALSIKQVDGTLTNFSLAGLQYHYQQVALSANELSARWDLNSLRTDIININSLRANGLVIDITTSTTPSNKTTDFASAFTPLEHLQIDNVTITNSLINEKHIGRLQIKNLTLSQQRQHQYTLAIATNKGDITSHIFAIRQKGIMWKVDMTATNIASPDNSLNQLSFNLYSEGKADPTLENASLVLTNLKAKLKNFPVTGLFNFQYDHGRFIINAGQLSVGKNTLVLLGKVSDQWTLRYQLNIPTLDVFMPLIKGSLNSNGDISGLKTSPQLNLNINLARLKTDAINLPKATIDVSGKITSHVTLNTTIRTSAFIFNKNQIKPVNGNIAIISTGLSLDDRIHGQFNLQMDKNNIIGTYQLPKLLSSLDIDQPFTSDINFNIPDFASIVKKLPYVDNLRGHVTGNLSLSGNTLQPKFKVMAQLTNGRVRIPSTKVQFNNITVSAISTNVLNVTWKGSATTSTGNLQFHGVTDLSKPDIKTALDITGKNIYFINTKEYQILTSPKLTIKYWQNNLSLSGEVFIPSAKVAPIDFNNVVTLPSDMTFKHKSKFDAQAFDLSTNVKLILGDKIAVDYANLNANLAGIVTIIKKGKNQAIAVGELHAVKGIYKAYGKKLNIHFGRLIYLGAPITNPSLDIEALYDIDTVGFEQSQWTQNADPNVTPADKIQVGVKVRGSLKHPQLSLFSTPSMTQNNILSYLLFDTPANGLSATNSLTLMRAALDINDSNKTGFIDNIQNKLNSFGISTQNTEIYDPTTNTSKNASSVKIGKQLGDRLSISYQTGIFDHFSVFSLRYKLGKYWALQTQTNNLETATDLLFEIEK